MVEHMRFQAFIYRLWQASKRTDLESQKKEGSDIGTGINPYQS